MYIDIHSVPSPAPKNREYVHYFDFWDMNWTTESKLDHDLNNFELLNNPNDLYNQQSPQLIQQELPQKHSHTHTHKKRADSEKKVWKKGKKDTKKLQSPLLDTVDT